MGPCRKHNRFEDEQYCAGGLSRRPTRNSSIVTTAGGQIPGRRWWRDGESCCGQTRRGPAGPSCGGPQARMSRRKTQHHNTTKTMHRMLRLRGEVVELFSRCEINRQPAPRRQGPNQTGEFDPGSERTLAACLTHASRARNGLRPGVKRRTGEYHVSNVPQRGG